MHTLPRLRRLSACTLLALAMLILSGCYTIRTPDGFTLTRFTGPSGVRGMLGEPDMIESADIRQAFTRHTATSFTYLDRGYQVQLTDDRVSGVAIIYEVQRAFIEQRVREYQEKLAENEPRTK